MEQSRIEFIRDSLNVYINLVSGISAEEREPYLTSRHVEPPIYTNYFDEKAEPPLPKYQIAKFAPMPYIDDNKSSTKSRHLPHRPETLPPAVPSKSPRTPAIKPPIARMIQDDNATEQLLQRRANLYSSSEKIKNNPNPSMKVPTINIPGENNSDDNEDDHTMDPRANILVKLGDNVFELESSEADGGVVDPLSTTQDRRNKRKSSSNLKIDEDFDLSIRDLLQELGVHDKPADQQKRQTRKEVAPIPQAQPLEPQVSYYTSGQPQDTYVATSAPQHLNNDKHYYQTEPQHAGYYGSQEPMYYSANSQQQPGAYVEYGQQTYQNQQPDMTYYHANYPQEQSYTTHKAYYPAASPIDGNYTYGQQPYSQATHPQISQSQLSYTSGSTENHHHNSGYPLQWDGQNASRSQQYYP
ncbi:hypothetical protein INT43_007337 [Umbelopsis isabellina]|uniref:Uncharacterized protein n=1 Tax=Mortierella isabellina TaxID=91625 RepID=A0A8H7UHZ4_MORIS|nr:hypothetical protein INT43_007337 [Umbelopsis isabellina]